MIRLRLFSSAQPSCQIDQRMIGEDAVVIGRDASADWVIADPDRALSRRHCTVRLVGAAIGVRDTSANGTFVGESSERIPPDVETIVTPGGMIRLGTFSLSVEAPAVDLPATSAPIVAAAATPSLFAPPAGLDPVNAPARPSRPDPFASQLVPDPLLADHKPGDRVALGDGDAWERRPAARAGDWDVPRERDGHENLIGTPREWAEPARAERDAGFGFDAPFDRPVLMAAPATAADIAIPEDWAEPTPPPAKPATKAKAAKAEKGAKATVLGAPSAPIEPTTPSEAEAAPVAAPPPAPVAAPPAAPVPIPPPVATVPILPPRVTAVASPGDSGAVDDAGLFEAFCAGARLSPASFSVDERAAAMTRLGEVYRGMVLGLADLMSERSALKNEYRLSRTMVRAEQNNPFKWAPPQRLAIEVLRGGDTGFAGGGEAVADSFRDIKMHILCLLAGMRAAITTTMGSLSPATTEAALEGRNFLIKAQRDAAAWVDYVDRFERFKADADDNADGPVNRAFRNAYEKQYAVLASDLAGYAAGDRPR